VLGGGGAKGAAHVGVLTLLDELHIPIDCVVGTSMGARVGGTYASGQTATELEKSIRGISWADTIAFQGYRERLPMRRKVAGVTYSNSLQFGFKDGSITAPRGFINTQNVAQTIKWLVALTLVSRTLEVLIGANEKQQLATLGPGDVTIIVPMGEVGSASFDKVGEAIPMGRAAAELHRAELARYSWPAGDYAAWRAAHSRPEQRSVRLADVRIEGLDRVNREYVQAHLGLSAGEEIDRVRLSRAMDRLFALDDFESVQYALRGDPEHPTLEVQMKEKSASPNILRFDVGFAMGTDGNTAFALGSDYLRPWINALGGETHGHLQIGRTSSFGLSLYQPLDSLHQWFVEPGLYGARGWLARLRYYRSLEGLGAQADYDRLEGMVLSSVPLWGNLIMLRGMGGTSFGTDLPVYDYFVFGGRTPLGPGTLSLGATSTDDWQIVFGLGRPMEERNVADPLW